MIFETKEIILDNFVGLSKAAINFPPIRQGDLTVFQFIFRIPLAAGDFRDVIRLQGGNLLISKMSRPSLILFSKLVVSCILNEASPLPGLKQFGSI